MKVIRAILILLIAANFVFAADVDVLKFKSKIGFTKEEDVIIAHKFFDNGKKVVFIGEKTLQFWDVENSKLINSVPHQIPQFTPKGFFNTFVLLSIPTLINWQPYFIEPDGKWLITIERPAEKKPKIAVVRDLQNGKQIKVLETPNVSIDYLSFDESKNEISTYGELDGVTNFSKWDKDTLELKKSININQHIWSQFIKTDEKILFNVGNTKQVGSDTKTGASLTLRDVKTGAIEKEYTAPNLIPGSEFYRGTVGKDDKYLMAQRDDRIFVWEIDGNGSPRFEISPSNPKEGFNKVFIVSGQYMIIPTEKKLRVYDFAGDGKMKYELASETLNDSVNLLSETKDGKYIAVADDRKISVLETGGNGKAVYEFVRQSEKERFTTVKFADDDKYLAVGRVNRSEKQPEKTEFYNTETGKLVFTAPFGMGDQIFFTNDKKFLYTGGLGFTTVFNIAEQKLFTIPLKVHYPETDSNKTVVIPDYPYNIEKTALSPNQKLILKYGNDVITVYDIEIGKEVQTIFDAEKVKYDKQNKVKKSGLGDAGWTMDGKYLFAFDRGSFRNRTVSLWQVSK